MNSPVKFDCGNPHPETGFLPCGGFPGAGTPHEGRHLRRCQDISPHIPSGNPVRLHLRQLLAGNILPHLRRAADSNTDELLFQCKGAQGNYDRNHCPDNLHLGHNGLYGHVLRSGSPLHRHHADSCPERDSGRVRTKTVGRRHKEYPQVHRHNRLNIPHPSR